MKTLTFVAAVAAVSSLWAGVPSIDQSSVTMEQSNGRFVIIKYNLTTVPAIMTVDIQTNVTGRVTEKESDWVSIGEEHFRDVSGDVNVLIGTTGEKTIKWDPFINASGLKAKHESCRAVVKAWAVDAPPDYLVVDLRRDNNRPAGEPRTRYYVSTNAFPDAKNVQDDAYRTDFMALRLIKSRGQTFRMGSPDDESGRISTLDNEDLHNVTFTNADFYCAIYPVTYGQLLNIGYWGEWNSGGKADIRLDSGGSNYTLYNYNSFDEGLVNSNLVAATCTWENIRGRSADGNFDWPTDSHVVHALSVCGQFRTRTGVDFDLLTEAQWEFCCRAGSKGSRYQEDASKIAWYDGNVSDGHDNKTARIVGSLSPNAWGLYDMLGGIFENCLDWYSESLGSDHAWDPVGAKSNAAVAMNGRVVRGGSYNYASAYARAACRLGTSDRAWVTGGARLMAPVGLKWPTTQDNRMLCAEYSLDADSIVTVDVQTNRQGAATADEADWVTIGPDNFTDVFGDVNCKVSAGSDKKVFWRADTAWPGHIFAEGAIRMVVKKWAISNPPDYLVIDLRDDETRGSSGSRERYYESADALPHGGIANCVYKQDYLAMRRIPAQGTRWCMGSPAGERGRVDDDETQHYVTFLQEDFYCAVYPVTCGQLARMGGPSIATWESTASGFFYDPAQIAFTPTLTKGWNDIRGNDADGHDWPNNGHAVDNASYVGKLIALAGRDFDLPTDAQWEFVARAGNGEMFGSLTADDAWFSGNSGNKGHEVGHWKANDWGIYECFGNIWELVLDWYGPMSAEGATDPCGPRSGDSRVWRGGTGSYAFTFGRCAARYGGALNYAKGLYGAFRVITPVSGRWPNGGKVLPDND